jgi:TIR domain
VAAVPRPLRRALIEAMGGWGPYTVREIANLFEDHGFEDTAQVEPEQGVRRTTAAEYLDAIDWDDRDQRRRLRAVIDEVLANFPAEQEAPGDLGARLRRSLHRALEAPNEDPVGVDAAGRGYERTTDQDDPFDVWPPGRIRLFFSHTSQHKVIVGAVANVLETWPMACFVAHEEIEPSLAWQEVIEAALRTGHALVAFVTDDFRGSAWCDQEVGWALGRGLVIIPVRLEADPHGFVGAIQAIPARLDEEPAAIAERIATALATAAFRTTRPGAGLLIDPLADAIVDQFCVSPSVNLARRRFEFLRQIPKALWTPERRLKVEAASEENRQISEAVLDEGGGPVPVATRALWE